MAELTKKELWEKLEEVQAENDELFSLNAELRELLDAAGDEETRKTIWVSREDYEEVEAKAELLKCRVITLDCQVTTLFKTLRQLLMLQDVDVLKEEQNLLDEIFELLGKLKVK